MVQGQYDTTTQDLLDNIDSLYKTKQIDATIRKQLILEVRKAVRTHNYSVVLNVLVNNTRFCSYPELIENCKIIIYKNTQHNYKEDK